MTAVVNKFKNHITAISLLLIAAGMVLGQLGYDVIKNLALIIATFIAGIPIFIKAMQALRMKAFSIELLVSIAVIGALFIGEYTESSIVTFLFLFGDYLEKRTLEKTRSSLKRLIDMSPKEAVVVRDGSKFTIPVEEVEKGDTVIIRSGSKVPVDGRIVSGQASLNEAAVTGESIPRSKTIDDKVFSGTIVDHGYIEMIAEKVGEDTTFAKIIELVEEAQESKSKTERFLNQFSAIYTPAVVVLSLIVFAVTRDLHMAITFLVIACPGALVIGAPVSNVAGIGNGARNGVLVKGSEVMDTLSKVDTLVFDKTGTLTKGKPEVTDIKGFYQLERDELLRLAAIAETISEHHLGQTIVREAEKRKMFLEVEMKDAEVLKGNGIKGRAANHQLVVGNRKLMNDERISIPDNIEKYALEREKRGNTAVLVAVDGKLEGIISIADQIREDAPKALVQLRKQGINKIIMLTGDNKHTAELVASQLGLDEYYAELLPENKVEHVKKQKAEGHIVAMAGDGINDAPAIAAAHIGLAMGENGTEISMETADVVLMADKLTQMSHAYSLAKATIRNMKQNTYFAVATVLLLLIGVLNGSVHLASGMFIHEASVLLVIINAMRLIRFRNRSNKARRMMSTAHVL